MDRLGCNLEHLITLLDELQIMGEAFVSLAEGIDATTPAGKLQLHILGTIAEFERARIAERVRAGLARARAQETEYGPNGNTHDGATQVVIPRQPVPKPMWDRQDPLHPSAAAAPGAPALSHRHRREHVVHQAGVPTAPLLRGGVEVRGAFRHPVPGVPRRCSGWP